MGSNEPTVLVGGTILGMLLKPNATPMSSAMSHACKMSALTGDTVTLNQLSLIF